jgi:hypothetical protein
MASAPRLSPIMPVHWNNTGVKVSNLHKGLQYLLRRESISQNDLKMILNRLRPEISEKKYRGVTAHYVGIYQFKIKQRLRDDPPTVPPDLRASVGSIVTLNAFDTGNGDVDEGTAVGMNWFLREKGARLE